MLIIDNVQVREPIEEGIQITEEPVWADNTARDVNSGLMIGDIITWKKTIQITWPPLTFAEMNTILNAIGVGAKKAFFQIKYNDNSATSTKTLTVYSSSLSRTIKSISNGYRKQSNVTVTFIER